jgi:hypothetical protein
MIADNVLSVLKNPSNMYNRELLFTYLVIIVVTIIIFTWIFPNKYGQVIILLLFAVIISETYLKNRLQKVSDFNQVTYKKLRTLRSITKLPLDNLYVDANMIHFLYSIISLNDYNNQEFAVFMKGVDNILLIRRQIEDFCDVNCSYPENITEMFETMLQLRTNTLNNLHDFIYTVPKMSVMYRYSSDIVKRYNILITRNTDIVYEHYSKHIKQTGISNRIRYIDYDKTKPIVSEYRSENTSKRFFY